MELQHQQAWLLRHSRHFAGGSAACSVPPALSCDHVKLNPHTCKFGLESGYLALFIQCYISHSKSPS